MPGTDPHGVKSAAMNWFRLQEIAAYLTDRRESAGANARGRRRPLPKLLRVALDLLAEVDRLRDERRGVHYVVLTGGDGQPGWFYGSDAPSLDGALSVAQRLATRSKQTAMVVVVHAYVAADGSIDRLEQSKGPEQAEAANA